MSPSPALSWYKVPEEIKRLLLLASEHWEDTPLSEHYMRQALAQSQADPDVLVAAYRYFFYKNNNSMALKIATQVIELIQTTEQLPEDWGQQILGILTRPPDEDGDDESDF